MVRFIGLLLVWAVLMASSLAAQTSTPNYVPGELLVKFRLGQEAAGVKLATQLGAKMVEEIPQLGIRRFKLRADLRVPDAQRRFSSAACVEYAQPNFIYKALFTPNDTYWTSQWGPARIQCPEAWDISKGLASVTIAILDTGIDKHHPDLSGKIVGGYDFVNSDNDPDDDHGHGTHCAGIAAAATNNAGGVAGVGFNCNLFSVKVLDNTGSGATATVVQGVQWAAANGAKVISMSLGGHDYDTALQSAVNLAWSSGCLLVAAAGNDGADVPTYPAYFTNCIAVASTDSDDWLSSFSNYGESWVDVAAPGNEIFSTYPLEFGDKSGYGYLSGTSQATPHVAGLAGLLFSYYGIAATNSSVRGIIENNCDPVNGGGVYYGRINAYYALTASGFIMLQPVTPGAQQSGHGNISGKFNAGQLEASTGAANAIYGQSTGSGYSGVWGHNTGSGTGVSGSSASGKGVWGHSNSGVGVYGTGVNGVHGQSAATNGSGVWGHNTGSGTGVSGSTGSSTGAGVWGYNSGATGKAVYAQAAATSGVNFAVYAKTGSSTGYLFYGVGPGANSPHFWVSASGNVRADGTFASPAADFAEVMRAEAQSEALEPGDVVVLSGTPGCVKLCSKPGDPLVLGVYSAKPSFLGGVSKHADSILQGGELPVALVGIVPVKICGESGAVGIGDLLTSSSTPGHAMKAVPIGFLNGEPVYRQGSIIGKALEPFSGDTGRIKMLVLPR